MGKGGMSIDDHVEQQNMAAWLVGLNTLKIQPFNLPTLGIYFTVSILLLFYCWFFM